MPRQGVHKNMKYIHAEGCHLDVIMAMLLWQTIFCNEANNGQTADGSNCWTAGVLV